MQTQPESNTLPVPSLPPADIAMDMDIEADELRNNLRAFMQKHGLKPTPWAKKAGMSDGALRAFLSGKTSTMYESSLKKLAGVTGGTVQDILQSGGVAESPARPYRAMPASQPVQASNQHPPDPAIDPGLIMDAYAMVTEIFQSQNVIQDDKKELALRAAQMAANGGYDVITEHLVKHLYELHQRNKKGN